MECLKLRGTEHEGIISADIPSATDAIGLVLFAFLRTARPRTGDYQNDTLKQVSASVCSKKIHQNSRLLQELLQKREGQFWDLVFGWIHHLQTYYYSDFRAHPPKPTGFPEKIAPQGLPAGIPFFHRAACRA